MKYLREQTKLKKKLVKRLNRLWNITRSDDYHEDGLITLSFQKKYTLFGSKTAESIGHHQASCISIYNNEVLSEDDYSGVIRHISEFS